MKTILAALTPFLLLQAALSNVSAEPTVLSSRGGLTRISIEGTQDSAAPIVEAPDGSLYLALWRNGAWQANVFIPPSMVNGQASLNELKFKVKDSQGTKDLSLVKQVSAGFVFRGSGLTLRTYRNKPIATRPNEGLIRTQPSRGLVWPNDGAMENRLSWQGFWAVWTGSIVAEHSGRHEFRLKGDISKVGLTVNRGPVRVVDGAFSLDLKAGEPMPIRLEGLIEKVGGIALEWTPPLGPTEAVPASRLQPETKGAIKPTSWQAPDDFPIQADWKGAKVLLPAPKGGSGSVWARVQQPDGVWLHVEAVDGKAEMPLPDNAARSGRLFPTSWLAAGEDGVTLLPGPDIIQAPAPVQFAGPAPDAGLDPDYLNWEKALEQKSETEVQVLTSRSALRAVYEPMAREAARNAGLNESIFCRMIEVESGWDPNAMSPVGAMGLGQLMPGTAFELGVDDPFDPQQNLAGAAKYLAKQYKRFGSYLLALAAYNAGPGAVSRHGGVPPYRETRRYVRKILGSG